MRRPHFVRSSSSVDVAGYRREHLVLGSSMEVRLATALEVPLLAALNEQLLEDEGHRNQLVRAELEERMREWLAEGYSAHLFYIDSSVAGYVLHCDEPSYVYVRHFFVSRGFRRQGLGTAAFRWMRQNIWGESCRLRLDVLVHNKSAIAFWRSLGLADYCLTMELEAGATS